MISCDYREPDFIKQTLSSLVETVVETKVAADYSFTLNDVSVGIERKAVGDFIGSLRSARLDSELRKCLSTFNKTILVFEGVYDCLPTGEIVFYKYGKDGKVLFRSYISPNIKLLDIFLALESLISQGVEVRYTTSMMGTVNLILALFKNEGKTEHTLLKRYPKEEKVLWTTDPYVHTLVSIPNVRLGEQQAKALLKKYKTPWGILKANPEDIVKAKIERVGKETVAQLFKAFGK